MSKYYSTSKIKEIIESRKDDIVSADVGMAEDWFWTAVTVYSDGEYNIDLSDATVVIAGINSSFWATPEMHCVMKNGDTLVFPVWFVPDEAQAKIFDDENKKALEDKIRQLKEMLSYYEEA